MTNLDGRRGVRRDVGDTSMILVLLWMNHSCFTGSSITKVMENFVEEFQKVFDIMHDIDAQRVELVAYQLKGGTRIWFDQ